MGERKQTVAEWIKETRYAHDPADSPPLLTDLGEDFEGFSDLPPMGRMFMRAVLKLEAEKAARERVAAAVDAIHPRERGR